MNRTTTTKVVFFAMALIALFQTASAFSQLAIDSYTIDCGGGESAGGDFALVASIGQQDAGFMSGGGFDLDGGFLPGKTVGGGCICHGDLNGDSLIDGGDIQKFTDCLIGVASDCECADVHAVVGLDMNDVTEFVSFLLTGTTCP
ncbi:MAG: hypothetical protein MI923_21290 [Phycisphaerales bacterium]|nr:hypothetical protein [Phycisphaerales bacterium]